MAEGLSDARRMSLRLAKWMKETMKLPSTQNVESKQLAANFLPMCKGQTMLTFWENIMTSFTPETQAELGSQEELLAKLEEKKRKLHELREDVASQELQLENKKEDLRNINQEVYNSRQVEQLMQMKSHMYSNYHEYLNDVNTRCKIFVQWISKLCDIYDGNSDRETTKTNSERDNVELACKLLEEDLDADDSDPEQLFLVAGELRKNYSPKAILSAYSKFAETLTEKLREDLESSNSEKEFSDFERLRSEVAQEFGTDSATLESRLRQWDIDCLKRSTQSSECEQNCDAIMKEAASFRERIIDLYKQQYEFDPTALQLAIDILDAQGEVAASRACLQSFQSSAEQLQQEIEDKNGIEIKLHKMQKKFNELTETMKQNNQKILEMTEHKKQVISSLSERQLEAMNAREHEIYQTQSKLTEVCDSLKSSFEQKLKVLDHADMTKLHQVQVSEELKPVKQLSIHRYDNISLENGNFSYQKALRNLRIHSHVPPSTALQKILHVKSEIDRLERLGDSVDASEINETCEDLQKLHAQCIESDKRTLENLEHLKQNGQLVAEIARSQCEELEKTIQMWSEQPAQHQTPWLIRDELTLEEWKTKKATS